MYESNLIFPCRLKIIDAEGHVLPYAGVGEMVALNLGWRLSFNRGVPVAEI